MKRNELQITAILFGRIKTITCWRNTDLQNKYKSCKKKIYIKKEIILVKITEELHLAKDSDIIIHCEPLTQCAMPFQMWNDGTAADDEWNR